MQIRQPEIPAGPQPPVEGVVALAFAEIDQFAQAIRHEDVEILQPVAGRFSNRVLLIPLAGTLVRYGTHPNPFLCSATALPGHVSVVLDTVSQGPTLQNGQPIFEAQALGLHGSGAEHFSRSSPGEYFYAPFPEAQFQAVWRAVTGQETAIGPGQFRRVRPDRRRWQALLKTIEAIRIQAEDAPEAFGEPAMRAAVEGSLLNALVLAAAADQESRQPASPRSFAGERPAIVRRAQEYLRAHGHTPVYLLELCEATGVGERTLRAAFLEQCGMGPMRFLKLRRLHLVRQALRDASPTATAVKKVALDNGFWDLGRFAVEYRQLFGESPSKTLRAGAPTVEPYQDLAEVPGK